MPNNATGPFRRVLPNDFSIYLEEHPSIPVGSSLSVMGALLLIVRERFSRHPDQSMPWSWQNDSKFPGEYKEDPSRSNITIELANQDDNDIKEKKPAILISRGPISAQKLYLDDKTFEDRPTGAKLRHNMASGAFSFICKSYVKGESEILANIIFEWLMYCNDIFRKFFQFHDVGPFSLGNEMPGQKASDIRQCVVECRLSWEHRWSVTPLAPKLSGIIARIYGGDDAHFTSEIDDTSELLVQIASSSLGRLS